MTFSPVDPNRTETVYAAIRRMNRERGLPVTIRELQAACEISSTSVVVYHIAKLERQGRIRRDPGISRSIRPVIEEAAA